MKKILILGGGEMQIPVIQKARQLNLYAIVADYDKDAPGFSYANEKLTVSTLDYPALLSYAREVKVDGILTTSDYPVNMVAAISWELELASMTIEVAKLCTNKYLQRTFFQARQINTPFFKLCDQTADLSEFINFPYIVKPVDSSASRGVQKVNNPQELQNAFQQALSYSKEGKVLIESFINGREFSVETYTQKQKTTIISITEKLVIGEEYGAFVEDTHIEPARISQEEYEQICSEVLKAIEAIGFDNCPSHTEIKLNAEGAHIIEIACRLGGDYIASDLVPLSTGIDMLENLIKISLNEEIDIAPKWNKVSCVQFLNTKNYNRCVDFIRSGSTAVIRYQIKEYTDSVIKNSLERLGYIILQTDTLKELEEILEKIK